MGLIATLLLVPWIAPGPAALRPMILIMTCCGFFLGLSSRALPSLLADIVDDDVWRSRQDRAAIPFQVQALVTKLNQGVGGAIALATPALFGFSPREPLALPAPGEGNAAMRITACTSPPRDTVRRDARPRDGACAATGAPS